MGAHDDQVGICLLRLLNQGLGDVPAFTDQRADGRGRVQAFQFLLDLLYLQKFVDTTTTMGINTQILFQKNATLLVLYPTRIAASAMIAPRPSGPTKTGLR